MDELAVLAVPAVLVTGLVLVGLGVDGRARLCGRGGGWGGFRSGRRRRGFVALGCGTWLPSVAGLG